MRAPAVTLREAWRAAPSSRAALADLGQYFALRLWALVIGCFPIETNLRTARVLGLVWWRLMKRHRDRAMENLRPALGDRYSEPQLRDIARRSFQHFAQVYLVELLMTPRLINRWSWPRHVELDELGPALRELLRDRGVLLLTPHFGNYELLGHTIAELGLPMTAIMRPLDNALITDYLVRTRKAGGVDLLFKKGAMQQAGEIVGRGEPLSFIADQDAGRKGVFADFFGRSASWYKSIGLLAMHQRVPMIVGCAARVGSGFRYRISAQRIIQPEEWDGRDNPLQWITGTFAAAMETIIRRHPEQYLWMHRRWKTQPRANSRRVG
jgi:KDO2-lipid IV(A) lauroyltransferase